METTQTRSQRGNLKRLRAIETHAQIEARRQRGYAFDELTPQRLRRKVRELSVKGVAELYSVDESKIRARLDADPAWSAWGKSGEEPTVRKRSEIVAAAPRAKRAARAVTAAASTETKQRAPRAPKFNPYLYAEGCEWHVQLRGFKVCEESMELRVISGDGERSADCCAKHAQRFLSTASSEWKGAHTESIPEPYCGRRNETIIAKIKAEKEQYT